MGVPAGARQAELVPEDGHESPAGLDQPAGRQRGLAEERHAVEIAGFVGFLAQVERAPQLSGPQADRRPSNGGDRCRCGSPRRRPGGEAARSARAAYSRVSSRSSVSSAAELRDAAQLEPAFRSDAAIGLQVFPDVRQSASCARSWCPCRRTRCKSGRTPGRGSRRKGRRGRPRRSACC